MIRVQQKTALNSNLELTPLIDIIFIVVVFLLLTANTRLLSLPVDIPDSDSEISVHEDAVTPLSISLLEDAPIYGIGDDRFYEWSEFKQALLINITDQKERALSIAAAQGSDVGPLLKLLALLNEQKVTNTQILMEDAQP